MECVIRTGLFAWLNNGIEFIRQQLLTHSRIYFYYCAMSVNYGQPDVERVCLLANICDNQVLPMPIHQTDQIFADYVFSLSNNHNAQILILPSDIPQ